MVQVSGRDAPQRQRAAEVGVVLGGGDGGRGARQLPSQGSGELVGGERGPGGGQGGQHCDGVGPLVLAVGIASALAAARQQRLEVGHQVGGMDVQAAGDLDEDPNRPVVQWRVRAADLVRVDAEQVAQFPG
jgi:hypothetical protein